MRYTDSVMNLWMNMPRMCAGTTMVIFRQLLSILPINVDIVGRNRGLVLHAVDYIYSSRGG